MTSLKSAKSIHVITLLQTSSTYLHIFQPRFANFCLNSKTRDPTRSISLPLKDAAAAATPASKFIQSLKLLEKWIIKELNCSNASDYDDYFLIKWHNDVQFNSPTATHESSWVEVRVKVSQAERSEFSLLWKCDTSRKWTCPVKRATHTWSRSRTPAGRTCSSTIKSFSSQAQVTWLVGPKSLTAGLDALPDPWFSSLPTTQQPNVFWRDSKKNTQNLEYCSSMSSSTLGRIIRSNWPHMAPGP